MTGRPRGSEHKRHLRTVRCCVHAVVWLWQETLSKKIHSGIVQERRPPAIDIVQRTCSVEFFFCIVAACPQNLGMSEGFHVEWKMLFRFLENEGGVKQAMVTTLFGRGSRSQFISAFCRLVALYMLTTSPNFSWERTHWEFFLVQVFFTRPVYKKTAGGGQELLAERRFLNVYKVHSRDELPPRHGQFFFYDTLK